MAEPNNTLLQKLDGIDARFQEVSLLITDPAVIGDMKRFVKLTKEYKDLEKLTAVTSRYKKMLQNVEEAKTVLENESDPDLRELAKEELESDTNELPKIEEEIKLLLIPEDPEDSKNVILEIRGGTGGDEAAIFAGDLFRMYAKYCESKGWKMEVMSYSEGAAGGYKEIISSVSGEKVYGTLKYESGVRVRYNWKNPNTGITEEILIECTETRDQPKNKERALARLRTFIYDKEHQKYIDDIASRRKTMVSTGDRSAKIRTYNYPQGRITDHRINYTIYNLPAFMDGDIQECIDNLIIAENAEKLKESEL